MPMNDKVSRIKGRIEALQEELRAIIPARHSAQRIADCKRGIAILQDQLERIERMHQRFLEGRAELLARCDQFSRPPAAR